MNSATRRPTSLRLSSKKWPAPAQHLQPEVETHVGQKPLQRSGRGDIVLFSTDGEHGTPVGTKTVEGRREFILPVRGKGHESEGVDRHRSGAGHGRHDAAEGIAGKAQRQPWRRRERRHAQPLLEMGEGCLDIEVFVPAAVLPAALPDPREVEAQSGQTVLATCLGHAVDDRLSHRAAVERMGVGDDHAAPRTPEVTFLEDALQHVVAGEEQLRSPVDHSR